jgi:DNA-binding LacI/PurR family transcriptional regulator
MIFEDDLIDLAHHQIPMLSWGPVPATLEDSITVMSSDNEMGGYLATRYLLEKGRRRLSFFGDTSEIEVSLRYLGFQRALNEFGLQTHDTRLLRLSGPTNMTNPTEPIDLFFDNVVKESVGSETTESKAQSSQFPIDGIVAVSDVFAMGAITSLARRGIAVPQDVSVVGYDDLRASAFFNPPLTTITQDFANAARCIGRSLAEFIMNDQPLGKKMASQTKLPVRLVVRESA